MERKLKPIYTIMPIAVFVAIERYNAIEELLDRIEDYELGKLAREREKRSSKKDYISLEAALRRVSYN